MSVSSLLSVFGISLAPLLPVFVLAMLVVCLYFSFKTARQKWLFENLPTSTTRGVFIGLVELKGIAHSEQPLISALGGVPCVYYAYDVYERWTRTVTEASSDSSGNNTVKTFRKTDWTNVASGGVKNEPFYLKDEHGTVLVRPEGAEITPPSVVFDTSCGPGDPLYFGKGPSKEVEGSDHIRQFIERAIKVDTPLYVVGRARQREDAVAAEIAADVETPVFLITTKTEETVKEEYGKEAQHWGLIGLVILFVFKACTSDPARNNQLMFDPKVSLEEVVWYCNAFLTIWAAGWALMIYNSMIELRQRVRQGWANVDVQLKRRADLVPALVDVVMAGREHESGVQSTLAVLRAQAGATAPGASGPDPAAVGGSLRALAEDYPDLRANDSFLHLQKQLADTEERIAHARTYFNEIATFYNTRLQQFPDGFIARAGFMRPQPLLESGGFEAP